VPNLNCLVVYAPNLSHIFLVSISGAFTDAPSKS
jgi:hypothetical protein